MTSQRQAYVNGKIFAELFTFNGGAAENHGRVVDPVFRTTAYNAVLGNQFNSPDCGLIAPTQLPLAGAAGRVERRATYLNAELVFVVEVSSHGLTEPIKKINDLWRHGPAGVLKEAWAINVAQRRVRIWTAALLVANPATDGWGAEETFQMVGNNGIVNPGTPPVGVAVAAIHPSIAAINGFAFNFNQLYTDIRNKFI